MSRPRPDLSVDEADIYDYIQYLATTKGLIEVRVWGSRSPKKPRKARLDSDWDLLVIWDRNLRLPSPRLKTKGLHIDVVSISAEEYAVFKNEEKLSVEVYPVDKYNLLKRI